MGFQQWNILDVTDKQTDFANTEFESKPFLNNIWAQDGTSIARSGTFYLIVDALYFTINI